MSDSTADTTPLPSPDGGTLPPPAPLASPERRGRRLVLVIALAVVAALLVATAVAWRTTRADLDASRDDVRALRSRVADLEETVTRLETQAAAQDAAQDDGEDRPDPDDDGGEGDPPATDELGDLLDALLGDGDLGGLLGGLGADGGLGGPDAACLGGGALESLLDPGEPITGPPDQQVETIASIVADERGLAFEHEVDPVFLDDEAFEERLAASITADYDRATADVDGRVLAALGVVEPGTDLFALQQELLGGAVAGFYDPDTGELVVRLTAGSSTLGLLDQMTLAHELDHALTDQVLDLPEHEAEGDSDANLATLALIEGDATLLMQRFTLAHADPMALLGSLAGVDDGGIGDYPHYLQKSLVFPYEAGLSYVCALVTSGGVGGEGGAGGGWDGVDEAYDDPPRTTSQILWTDGVTDPAPTPELGRPEGWEVVREDTIGAADLLWLFQAPGDDADEALPEAEVAARAWAGGHLRVAVDGERTAIGLSIAERDDGVLCTALEDWFVAAFDATASEDAGETVLRSDRQSGVLRCTSDGVVLGIGPDVATARQF